METFQYKPKCAQTLVKQAGNVKGSILSRLLNFKPGQALLGLEIGSALDYGNFRRDDDFTERFLKEHGVSETGRTLARFIPGAGLANTLESYWAGRSTGPRLIAQGFNVTAPHAVKVFKNPATQKAVMLGEGAVDTVLGVGESLKNKLDVERKQIEQQIDTANKPVVKTEKTIKDILKENPGAVVGGALGAAGLGLGGYALYKWLSNKNQDNANDTRMKMRIKTPDGKDAIVDMPISNPILSGQLAHDFNTGVTRETRRIAQFNSLKKDPETGKFIPYEEFKRKYGDTYKQANIKNLPKANLVDGTIGKAQDVQSTETSTSSYIKNFIDAAVNDNNIDNYPIADVHHQYIPKAAAVIKNAADLKAQSGIISETVGGLTGPVLAGLLGAGVAKHNGADTKGTLIAGGLSALSAPLLGAAASAIAGSRTAEQQAEHDDAGSNNLLNTLLPGYAQFNALQRSKAVGDSVSTPLEQKPQVINQPLQEPLVGKPDTQSQVGTASAIDDLDDDL